MDQGCGNQEMATLTLDNGEMGKFKDLESILPPMDKDMKDLFKNFWNKERENKVFPTEIYIRDSIKKENLMEKENIPGKAR